MHNMHYKIRWLNNCNKNLRYAEFLRRIHPPPPSCSPPIQFRLIPFHYVSFLIHLSLVVYGLQIPSLVAQCCATQWRCSYSKYIRHATQLWHVSIKYYQWFLPYVHIFHSIFPWTLHTHALMHMQHTHALSAFPYENTHRLHQVFDSCFTLQNPLRQLRIPAYYILLQDQYGMSYNDGNWTDMWFWMRCGLDITAARCTFHATTI